MLPPMLLPRRPALGLRGVPAPGGGVDVAELRPGSASAALLRPGDRLRALAGAPLPDLPAIAAELRRHRAGDTVELRFDRDGHPHAVDLRLDYLPEETCPEAHVLYDSLDRPGGRLRTIAVRPPGPGPHPALLLLPGLACASLDFALAPTHPLRPLVVGLAAAGVATLRVERPGLGDSEGGPCEALGWWDEVELHRAALAALAVTSWVDRDALGLFGHSVGGMLAPLVARGGPVRRICVFGTCARPWSQCVQRAAERQAPLRGRPVAAMLAAAHTGRSERYIRELEATDLAAAWSALTGDVLVVSGGRDLAIDPADARALADLLARRPAGATRRLELGDLDHAMTRPDGAACERLPAALAGFARGLPATCGV
jgi:uncharacterized protein